LSKQVSCAFRKSRKAGINFIAVRLSANNSAQTMGRISMKVGMVYLH